ncbi:gluconate 2-dehydrogenase subunit 3 family protein [Reichenbachiella sp. MALMAid0571]|uniref:gluconate 2-dehydrogenase subunit 3 family protein n=1 Tax=Reichenbachiella sp. MALMAid0571 TaxID=3143939 RepID=UPI0032DE3042
MDRRKALKSITLSTGIVISSGTLMTLLQSCQEKDSITWVPKFLSEQEAITISELSNIILPSDEMPGALDVGVPQVIDLMMKDVFEDKDNDKYRKGLKAFSSQFKKENGVEFHEGSQEKQQAFVEKLYNLSEDETDEVLSLVRKSSAPSGQEDKYFMYSFLVDHRKLTINFYFTSEKVGEEILSYDPVPGRQEGCVPVEQVGNVWSL